MSYTGDYALRRENIDHAVKAVALMEYKLKTLCNVDSSGAWVESFFRETNTDPTNITTGGGAYANIKGVRPQAPFPYGQVAWTKVSINNNKFACEGLISLEDESMGNLDVLSRTILRVARAIAKAEDAEVAANMLASAGNTFAITAGNEWDSATVANRDPVYDILYGIDMIRKDNLDALNGNGYLCVNGTDYTNILRNSKVINNPTFKSADVVSNGVVGEICGLKIMVTEVLEASTPDVAYIVIKNEAMTWKEVQSLKSEVVVDPGKSKTIRAWSIGSCAVVSPNAICKITNTRA